MEIRLTLNGKPTVRKVKKPPAFAASYDVAVVGLGTAGAEALSHCVARKLKTFGIERQNGMGGLSTVGIVCFGGGLNRRLCDYERIASSADVAYGTVIAGVWTEGRRIVGVRTLANGAVRDVAASVVIDATGNATVARMCGCALRKGRAFDGVMASCARGETWVDNGKRAPRPIYRNYPDDLARSAEDYSATVTKLARGRHEFWLSQRTKGRMLRPSVMVGPREEVRVVAEETATMADAIAGKVFPNPLFFACEPEDLVVHYGDHVFESREIRNWKVHCGLPMFYYPSSVPYGTIVAKGMENLLVPSKHFGVAHDLGGSLRMQPEMRKTGIAAAFAAEIMLRLKCAAKDVPYAELKPLLEEAGCLKPARDGRVNTIHGKKFEPFADDEVVASLRQDVTRTGEWWQGERGRATGSGAERAAYALWTAWERGVRGTKAEKSALAAKLAAELGRMPRYDGNFAIALALMGDARAVPVLRDLVAHPGGATDPVVAGAFPNRIKAIDFLGRFADEKSVSILMAIVGDGAKAFTAGLAAAGAFGGGDVTCRFQSLAYALTALRAILEKHPDRRAARRIAELQEKLPPFKAADGYDLGERLRRVSFTNGTKSR